MNDREEFIYLDNGATTWPKPDVVCQAVAEGLDRYGANPGRSSHRMSRAAEQLVERARLEAARMFHVPRAEQVIFTLNGTDSLNIVLKGLLKPGSRVVTSPYEHNSVMRPLRALGRNGIELLVARPTGDFSIDLSHLQRICDPGVELGVFTHASNVTGAVLPIREIAGIVHSRGGIMVVDAAQTAGALHIDLSSLGADVIAASGHKGLLGPMGTGLLLLNRDLPIAPFREGGTGYRSEDDDMPPDLPWRLEAGTGNVPGIAGLLAGLRFIREVGVEQIGVQEKTLALSLIEGLRQIDGVQVFSNPERPLTGVVSFIFGNRNSADLAEELDRTYAIGLRGGVHCSPSAHKALDTFPQGTLRASFGYFNDQSHVERLLAAVREMAAR